uniref:BCD1 alpha/beta domain-containing protein n=1 Tax=Leptocylindrus danicus TaxID=163516 RepID=A0A7S2L9M2_9STRA
MRSNVKLVFMSRGMDRRRLNTSYYNIKKNLLYWRVEFVFHMFDSLCDLDNCLSKINLGNNNGHSKCSCNTESVVIERVDDATALFDEIDKVVKERGKGNASPLLKQYVGVERKDLNLFMKIEPCSSSRVRFHRIDGSVALQSAISNCNLIEFPTFEVALKAAVKRFPTLIQDVPNVEGDSCGRDVDG